MTISWFPRRMDHRRRVLAQQHVPDQVTEASWEIRSGVSSGNGGAGDRFRTWAATLTKGSFVGNGVYNYQVQVDGLSVQTPAWKILAERDPGDRTDSDVCVRHTRRERHWQSAGTTAGVLLFNDRRKIHGPVQDTGQGEPVETSRSECHTPPRFRVTPRGKTT